MSETKRVVLNSLEPQKVIEKTTKGQCKSIRISVILPESNEDKCPEFNYKDELAAVKKKEKQNQNGKSTSNSNGLENGLDPLDDDDDVKRIALEMEAKYGTTTAGSKKKRKGKKDDYADIGMGYDESDSFIDNTDGYDEIIPQNVTTLHGGFYINSGALEFKTDEEASSEVSSSSSSEESENEEKPKRKRVLDTTEDDDSDEEPASRVEKSSKLLTPKNSIQQAIKKKLFSQKKIQVKKRRLMDPSKKTVKDLLREKRHDLDMSIPPNISSDKKNENGEKDPSKENKTPMSITSVTDAIESVIKQSDDRPPPISDYRSRSDSVVSDPGSKKETTLSKNLSDASGEGDSSRDGVKNDNFEVVKLPENLQSDIVEIISKIKKRALDYKDVGKVKFFSGDVNDMLLSLERKCKCLGKSSRVKVYEHLSPFVKCRKETLMRRAKSLVLEEDEIRIKKLVFKLKTQIDEVMPAQIRNHEKECQRVLQKKFSQEAVENEELKQLKNPRRRFHCPEELKKLLKELFLLKKKCLIADAKKKESTQENIEEQLSEYLKRNILVLWPDGWMSVGGLTRLCNSEVKPLSNKTQSSSHTSSTSSSMHHKHSSSNSNTNTLNNVGHTSNSLSINPVTSNNNNKMSTTHVNNVATSQNLPESIIKSAVNYSKDKIKSDKFIEKPPKHLPSTDSGVIVVNTSKLRDDSSSVIPNNNKPNQTHCQTINLNTTKEPEAAKPFKYNPPENYTKSISISTHPLEIANKYPELAMSASQFLNKNDGDDIQMVMENLKALQKLSSPHKMDTNSSTSSPVSVISYNKNSNSAPCQSELNPKASSRSELDPKVPSLNAKPTDFTAGFQDEYQKQFISSLSHLAANPLTSNKPNYRCS